ncbi:protein DEHYDRATION-INDUCED 19-like [Zingiber officinale]|uniref:protein DEHYDRATION-INDUCED 19-like n=1 Tax=Zingiber officinale TaxID=94328 RepID=UPI001C4C3B58|nr:protein DEHYDRATION-INDUCED 19-like [Zingiber officinale]
MDSDLWISRLAAAKRHYSTQHQQNVQSDRLSIDEFEMEEELRPDFTCPYCYEDHDISSLCSHIEEEHAFESTAAVCPICSIKVAKDMLNHITLQHGHIFKLQRRRRLRRFAIPSNQTLSLLGRDLREAHLQILLGNAGRRTNNNEESNIASDSFLSSLFMNFPTSEVEESSKPSTDDNAFLKTESDLPSFISGLNSSLTHEQKEQRRKQATVRATFVQDLLFSTLFDD